MYQSVLQMLSSRSLKFFVTPCKEPQSGGNSKVRPNTSVLGQPTISNCDAKRIAKTKTRMERDITKELLKERYLIQNFRNITRTLFKNKKMRAWKRRVAKIAPMVFAQPLPDELQGYMNVPPNANTGSVMYTVRASPIINNNNNNNNTNSNRNIRQAALVTNI